MENYIITHEEGEKQIRLLEELAEMRLISECHSKAFRYPTIKKWFLNVYPEIVDFGKTDSDGTSEKVVTIEQAKRSKAS